ncbi:MAG TPA: GyrI-like domain-containing protein [Bacillales bacterium]|nr:GyrI-like domain-containing protein [Bacillales bacterium]
MKMRLEPVERFKVVGIRIIDEMENLNARIQQAARELQERMHEIRGVRNPDVLYGISPPNYKGNPGPLDFYVCVEVDPFENLPYGMVNITIDPELYAVCTYEKDSMNNKGNAYDFTTTWLQEKGYEYFDAAYYFEVYNVNGEWTNLEDLDNTHNRIKVYSPVRKGG